MADNILSVVTSLADGALSHSQLTHHTKALTKVKIVNYSLFIVVRFIVNVVRSKAQLPHHQFQHKVCSCLLESPHNPHSLSDSSPTAPVSRYLSCQGWWTSWPRCVRMMMSRTVSTLQLPELSQPTTVLLIIKA